MLDDLQQIHELDVQDALGVAEKQWQQLDVSFQCELQAPDTPIQNIVFAGMGASALGAVIAQAWPGFTIPFEICRSFDVPHSLDENTLFIASSYSGDTQETLSALDQAVNRRAGIIVISSGGRLTDVAREKGYPLIELPKGLQPRQAVLASLKALLTITDALHVTSGAAAQLTDKTEFLKQAMGSWLPTVRTEQNQAKQIALECIGTSVVVYAGPQMASAAYHWKIGFNENAKHVAWLGLLPEVTHNEIVGWTKQPVDKPYAVIDLKSSFEHELVQKQFLVMERLLSGLRPSPLDVTARGEGMLEQLLWMHALGDFVTIYTALLNDVNPTPIAIVDKFKRAMEG